MTRITMTEPQDATGATKDIFERFVERGYGTFNVMKVFAKDEKFFAAFEQMFDSIYLDETLAPRYRELAWLRTSAINQCHY